MNDSIFLRSYHSRFTADETEICTCLWPEVQLCSHSFSQLLGADALLGRFLKFSLPLGFCPGHVIAWGHRITPIAISHLFFSCCKVTNCEELV